MNHSAKTRKRRDTMNDHNMHVSACILCFDVYQSQITELANLLNSNLKGIWQQDRLSESGSHSLDQIRKLVKVKRSTVLAARAVGADGFHLFQSGFRDDRCPCGNLQTKREQQIHHRHSAADTSHTLPILENFTPCRQEQVRSWASPPPLGALHHGKGPQMRSW